ncbi:hypothetical protein D9M69_330990 [compost metagenome]
MGADVQRGEHLAGRVAHRHRHRAQADFQFLIDDHPALPTNLGDAFAQRFRGVQGAAGLHLQVGMGQVLLERRIVEAGEQDAAHRGAVGRQPAAHAEVHRDEPLRSRRTGDVEDLVAFQGRHRAGLAQLLAAVADLGDGQVALALLEGMDHRQAAGQRGHEIGVAGEGLDTLGRRGDDRRSQGHGIEARFFAHCCCGPVGRRRAGPDRAIIEPKFDNRN